MTSEQPTENIAATEAVSWRELAVARSLDSARTRAESRVERFLDAALELMADGDTTEFTVQEVVERSGQSLRSFYQYFGGKHELMLALFEESIRNTAVYLREKVEEEADPLERVRRFVVEYYRLCRPAPKTTPAQKPPSGSPVLVEFAQQLLTAHPNEAARSFLPLVSLFEEVLDAAAEAGELRPSLHRRHIAGIVLESIMFNAFSATISGTSLQADGEEAADELWSFLLYGMGVGSTPS